MIVTEFLYNMEERRMNKTRTICFTVIIMLMVLFAGCTIKPSVDEIGDIPSNAKEVLSLDLTSESGTFSNGKIEVSGNANIVQMVRIQLKAEM